MAVIGSRPFLFEDTMISKESYEFVKKAIKVHSNLKDRTYLILYKASAKDISKSMEMSILEENFWHLVGCKFDRSIDLDPIQKHELYLDCVRGGDISSFLNYTRQPQDVSKKAMVVVNTFDFVSNAKQLRLCHTENAPEAVMFKVGVGDNCGIIGYGQKQHLMFPKTAQQKSIYKINSTANDKIFLILSKPYGHIKYDVIEYAISNKIFPAIITELPPKILYEHGLFSLIT